ncbi:unnamed protein product [Sympodiomycopsis kandeliae]
MVLHLSHRHHRAPRLLAVDEGDLGNWTYANLGNGSAAQKSLIPSGQQRERELLMSSGPQLAARKAELQVSRAKQQIKEEATQKARSLLGSSRSLLPEGNCSWRDSFCRKGECIKEGEWTAEKIADRNIQFH